MDKRTLLLLMAAGVAILLVLSLSFGMDQALTRWSSFRGIALNADRTLTYRVIIEHMIPRTGLFGIGPGNFEAAFASLVEAGDLKVLGRWDMAHNDYLQELVEWGWLGMICWATILGGALLRALRMIWDQAIPLEKKALGFGGSIALTGVLLHACVDFPLQITSIQLCVALLCGMLWGCLSGEKARKRKRVSKTP
jgi:O-antigen ligase